MNNLEAGKEVIRHLKANGKEAYFVGGLVRDILIDRDCDDIDITTNARPDEVMSLFDNVKNTGAKYGSVTVIMNDCKCEVTTYRKEGKYINNRKPESVSFGVDLKDDLTRRDFKMNALLMTEDEEVLDYLGGKTDIDNKVISCIGDPMERFKEDALRMLRAFRFSSQIGFDIDPLTLEGIKESKDLIQNISIERIMIELDKIFRGDYRQKALSYMVETGFHTVLFGLEIGIEYLSNVQLSYYPIEAFMVCFVLEEANDIWKFSNREQKLMAMVMNLHEVTKEGDFNTFILFSNGLDVCLLANYLSVLLGYKDQEEDIRKINDSLVVKDVCDLKFKGQDILQLTTLKKRSIIALVIDDLLYNVLMGIMPNEYSVLKEFALQRVEELQKEME